MHRHGLQTRLKVEQSLMIAPLLDIMFLVLLFFILNTNAGNVESFDVDIPQATQGENLHPSDRLVVIIRSQEQSYRINDQEVSADAFIPALQQEMQRLGVYQILLLASQEADYGRVMRSMDAMKQAGARGVSLGVEKIEE